MNKKSMLRAVRLAALLWASAFVLTGCGGGGDAIDTTVSYPSTADRIAMGWEPWPRPTYVVNTRDEWSRVWNERYASQSCYHFDGPDCVRAAMPEIDFDRFTLIGIYRELDPGQSLSLDSVEYKDGQIQVFTTLKASPGISASVQGSLSLFFLIPKTDLAVTFTERDEA